MKNKTENTLLRLINEGFGNYLPPASIYSELLSIAGATDKNRKKYGKFTINQWYDLLYNNKTA